VIPANEQLQTHALNNTATGIGSLPILSFKAQEVLSNIARTVTTNHTNEDSLHIIFIGVTVEATARGF